MLRRRSICVAAVAVVAAVAAAAVVVAVAVDFTADPTVGQGEGTKMLLPPPRFQPIVMFATSLK